MPDTILSHLRLSDEQRQAAFQTGCDTAVLAGAGCGKTSTLVSRYLYLLSEGLSPEEIVAITFTERAGQEMRVRIRRHLRDYLAGAPVDEPLWLAHYIALDAAPIGTIHSFCARLLRAHPAEAGLDPDAAVLDENQAAVLRAEAVERALVWATQDRQAAACFPLLGGPSGLRDLLSRMLTRRLEVQEALAATGPDVLACWRRAAHQWLAQILEGQEWCDCLADLEAMEPLRPGDALDACRCEALAAVQAARRALAGGDWPAALGHLAGLRKPGRAGRQENWGDRAPVVRAALSTLCDLYRSHVAAVAANADPALDEELAAVWPGLVALFRQAVDDYRALKAQALDFDDLEAGALRLLQGCPEVAAYERERIKALLVDEFQDTNDRQRRLFEALLGAPAGQGGRLFIVGDAKQSIYRFRGADVTVFRHVEREINQAGGQTHHLDRTYRAHAGLIEVQNDLLARVLGAAGGPGQAYRVPFAALQPGRQRPSPLPPPYIELHLGVGSSADEGRAAAAAALAGRLRELHQEGAPWREMACLFRASSGFSVYEEAFEAAGVPYVTVAGAGFYGRPEVRDLLNALNAVANPNDDLALAGLLRSPAIGLADASLYHLRWGDGDRPRPLWAALQGDLGALEPAERERAERAVEIIGEVAAMVGRQPVAAVLKRFLDLTGYRAILRLCPQTERAGRNVDKLLADAHRSGLVGVGDFDSYVQMLSDTAAREGEAPPEAGEAVQLMTVHKSKGLEFGVVVIADAGHDDRPRIPPILIHPDWGLLLRVTRGSGDERRQGLAHGLGCALEEAMQDAEERRLLYVAATRAKDKLLVSGHVRRKKDGISYLGWGKRLVEALDEPEVSAWAAPDPGGRAELTCWGGRVRCTLYAAPETVEEEAAPVAAAMPALPERVVEAAPDLILPTAFLAPCRPAPSAGREEPSGPNLVWRVIPTRPRQRGPRWLVGRLAHVGLALWRFPPDPALNEALAATARGAGLTAPQQVQATVEEALGLLERFQKSDLYRELAGAAERWHELPYAVRSGAGSWGRIDLLCRSAGGEWQVIDFKTHQLRTQGALAGAQRQYRQQLLRYGAALRRLLRIEPRLRLCFLDYRGQVLVCEVPAQRH